MRTHREIMKKGLPCKGEAFPGYRTTKGADAKYYIVCEWWQESWAQWTLDI